MDETTSYQFREMPRQINFAQIKARVNLRQNLNLSYLYQTSSKAGLFINNLERSDISNTFKILKVPLEKKIDVNYNIINSIKERRKDFYINDEREKFKAIKKSENGINEFFDKKSLLLEKRLKELDKINKEEKILKEKLKANIIKPQTKKEYNNSFNYKKLFIVSRNKKNQKTQKKLNISCPLKKNKEMILNVDYFESLDIHSQKLVKNVLIDNGKIKHYDLKKINEFEFGDVNTFKKQKLRNKLFKEKRINALNFKQKFKTFICKSLYQNKNNSKSIDKKIKKNSSFVTKPEYGIIIPNIKNPI